VIVRLDLVDITYNELEPRDGRVVPLVHGWPSMARLA
jgi:hypothetical protein